MTDPRLAEAISKHYCRNCWESLQPDATPEPVVTDAMVDAADNAMQDAGVCSHDVSPSAIRAGIEAALRAREHYGEPEREHNVVDGEGANT